jgi:hypothetical protein
MLVIELQKTIRNKNIGKSILNAIRVKKTTILIISYLIILQTKVHLYQ